KSPYADRGLDKFNALLADHDARKRKIYTQKGSEEISFVRFVYGSSSASASARPIVVVKFKKDRRKNNNDAASASEDKYSNPHQIKAGEIKAADGERRNRRGLLLKRPHLLYLPMMILLILLFLAFSGRSLAISFASVGWYVLP
ncbi:hypothetical protein M569_01785, partial [Genlisea aurea]